MASRSRQALKTGVFAVGKRVPGVLRAARSLRTRSEARRFRRETAGVAVEPRAAVFESYLGRSFSCSPRAIYEAMLADERYADWRLTWAFQEEFARALAAHGLPVRGLASGPGSGEALRNLDTTLDPTAFEALRRAEIVVHGSREYHESYARSTFWVTNSMLPQHLSPGPGQEYVQTWHGQPLKRLGCDVASGGYALIPLKELHRRYRFEGQRLTRLITPSRFTSETLTTAFGLSERKAADAIVEVGHPRNDLLRRSSPNVPSQRA